MTRQNSQVFIAYPAPHEADAKQLKNWTALNFRQLENYIKALEERIRPATLWVTLVDILPVDAWQVWSVDTVLVDTTGEGDYTVTISARVEGLLGQAEVQFRITTNGVDYDSSIIILGNGEVQYLTTAIYVDNATDLVISIRGLNVDVTNGRMLAVRTGA